MKCTCGNELLEGSKFCNNCGKPVGINCPNCGTSLLENSKFCHICGTNLEETYEFIDKETGAKFKSNISPDVINNCASEIDDKFDFATWVRENVEDINTRRFLIAAKDKVVWIGDKAVQIGKFLWSIVLRFKNTFTGIISAGVIATIISFIPFLGPILSPLVFAIFGTALGIKGLLMDSGFSEETIAQIGDSAKKAFESVFHVTSNAISATCNTISGKIKEKILESNDKNLESDDIDFESASEYLSESVEELKEKLKNL